ncbi:hypothetical protein [Streptosporangium sp. KLBMP 9127]|nr:hypothetical protein [Streptosporangium sp. KLBMP 9127]
MTPGDATERVVWAADDETVPATIDAIEEKFDHWWAWVSDTGTWWAARRSALTSAEMAAGCVHYLRTDDGAQLVRRLAEQDLARSAPEPKTLDRLPDKEGFPDS